MKTMKKNMSLDCIYKALFPEIGDHEKKRWPLLCILGKLRQGARVFQDRMQQGRTVADLEIGFILG